MQRVCWVLTIHGNRAIFRYKTRELSAVVELCGRGKVHSKLGFPSEILVKARCSHASVYQFSLDIVSNRIELEKVRDTI